MTNDLNILGYIQRNCYQRTHWILLIFYNNTGYQETYFIKESEQRCTNETIVSFWL